jgi:4'-phosphopantetheinyl transferase
LEDSNPVLSAEELRRAGEISNPLIRRNYEHTRSTVRKVLGCRLGIAPAEIQLASSPKGKPLVVGAADCEFSISHSGDFLVVATGNVPLGVDIETRSPRQGGLGVAERFFSAADFQILREGGKPEFETMFLRQWVAKEAALKALGMGIGGGLADAECEYHEGRIVAVRLADERIPVRPFSLADGTPGAVARRGTMTPALSWKNADELSA